MPGAPSSPAGTASGVTGSRPPGRGYAFCRSRRPGPTDDADRDQPGADAAGNLTAGLGRQVSYDAENRPFQLKKGGVVVAYDYGNESLTPFSPFPFLLTAQSKRMR
jgi:hypothetical protein